MPTAGCRERALLVLVCLVAAAMFLPGLTWGLPSRAADPFLFGPNRTPWTGAQVQALADLSAKRAPDDPNRGADVDADPLARSDAPVVLNPDDGARAEIVRRYRLFTYQPDEMITMMALAKMRPRQFDLDPKLYQYGGLWVYPVGLLLKATSVVGYVDLRGGGGGADGGGALAYYLDRPEAFGRFYVVARLYAAMWGVVGAAAVFAIARRVTASGWAAAGAGVLFAVMPVVVNGAHEAKPHLPGAALTLLAVLAAARYVETGRLAHAVAAGALCGLALGMVLSALSAFALLPAMVLLRRPLAWGDRARVAAFAAMVGGVAYAATNPYVFVHLVAAARGVRTPLTSNVGNSSAFYSVGRLGEGVVNVARLAAEGMSSWHMPAMGLIAVAWLGRRAWRARRDRSDAEVRRRAHGLLLAVPAVLTAIQAALVGAGKPGEFGRFLLLTDVFVAVEIVAFLSTAFRPRLAGVLFAAVTFGTAAGGLAYLRGFVRDAGPLTSRLGAARAIEARRQAGAVKRVLLTAEPAPYAVPPVNLFDLPLVLLPKGADPARFAEPGDVVVTAGEGRTPISWANKPVKGTGG